MKTLRSYVSGGWYQATADFVPLLDPCSEELVAQVSSTGLDFGGALEYARERGGPALREMTVAERGDLLMAISKKLQEHRDELIALSLTNAGATRKDAKFDIDGGIFTLAHYGHMGRDLGTRRSFLDGEGIQLGRTARFWGQHVLLPLTGVAVHINAFNFPVWGWAEKAACAWLAGMPTITKPATSTAMVTERAVEIVIESGLLPDGAASLICGSTGDLLDRLGAQDVLAFTGSAATALQLRGKPNLLESSTRVNIEADSLNAAVLGPDVSSDSEVWSVFLRDVEREMTQKTGQKCTAVRRILVPQEKLDAVQEALVERLGQVVVGNPADGSVNMGPLATARQLKDTIEGVAKLGGEAQCVLGDGRRVDGVGNPAGKGYFFAPTLLRATDPDTAKVLHECEVFGPVATLMPYDGSAAHAASLVGKGGGSLVTSLYSDDREFVSDYLARGGTTSGRLYLGSEKVAGQLPGSGVAMPQLLHGGPGRAGGGMELGGERGVGLYLQRVAVTGDRGMIERIAESSRRTE